MIQIRPEAHRGGPDNPSVIEVERSDEHGSEVWLRLVDDAGVRIDFTLLPEEAHALGAMLAHVADRAEGWS